MDFEDRIDDRMEELIARDDGFVIGVEAAKLVAEARERYPDELSDWLDERAEAIVSDKMRRVIGTRRAVITRRRKASSALTAALSGESLLDVELCVNEDNTWRALANMTAAECLFVANERERQAKTHLLDAAFMRAVAKRIPTGMTVKDVFDAAELQRVWDDAHRS